MNFVLIDYYYFLRVSSGVADTIAMVLTRVPCKNGINLFTLKMWSKSHFQQPIESLA